MTAESAHAIMQLHMDCLPELCAIKRQARYFLIETRKMTPDRHRDPTVMGY